MADARTYNVEDRIRELGEDPATAYAAAKANGMAGDAPPPMLLPETDPLSSSEYPSPEGPPTRAPKVDPFGGNGPAIVDAYAPPASDGAPLPHAKFSIAAPANTGSIADSVTGDVMPEFHGTPAVSQPLEPQASFGELFTANRRSAERDNPGFHDKMLHDGYAPIVQALGLDPSENPALFNDLDEQAQARFGTMGSVSKLATDAKQGETLFGNVYMADRPLQEYLVAAAIKAHRAKEANFMPGVPDTVPGLHAYFVEQQKRDQAADNAVMARSPGGLTGIGAALAGSTVASLKDPINDVAMAIPGGEGASLLAIAARDALINGVITAAQQPVVAANKAELGENYTAGDFATNVAGGAAAGAVLGPALHGVGAGLRATGIPQAVGKGVGATISGIGRGADAVFGGAAAAVRTTGDLLKTLPEAARARWSGRVDDKAPVGSFFSSLDNRELTAFARDAGANKLTPDQQSAANVLERGQEVGESSPYQPGPAGDGTHQVTLASAIKDLEDHRTPEVVGFPSVPAADGSLAASPAVAMERPPAPSTVGRPQPYGAAQDPEAAIQSFIPKVYHAENNTGNVHAQNPHSSASGPAQFTDGTFRDYYRKVYGTDPGPHADRELKDNPEVQGRLLEALTRDNAARLQHIGEAVNNGNLYMMHVLGEGDGAKVFKADPSTPMQDLVSAKVLEGNPQFRGKSASEAIAWAHARMGRADVAAVRAGAGPLEAATDDPRLAQLNDQALQLDDAVLASDGPSSDWGTHSSGEIATDVAGETRAAPLQLPPMLLQTISNRDIGVDAERFQFKSGGDEHGVTDRLQGVEKWNPMFAGLVTAWQDLKGKLWIADGHQRLGLANRISAATGEHIPLNAMVMREADGISAEDARTYAALKNIAEQDGKHPTGAQLVDAAKVARGFGPDALRAALPPKSALARDGAALARLSDRAFGAVYNDVVPADFAAVIGHLLPHAPETHEAMIELLRKLDPANRGQAASIVRQAVAAGIHKEEQVDLFGSHEHVSSMMLEKAKMIEKVLAELRKMKLVHRTAAEGAETLERTGSKIAKTASEKEALANAQAIETVNRLAYRSGPIADAISAAAAELKSGRGKLATLARDAAARIRELDLGALDRESAAGGAVPGEIGADTGDSLDFDGSGRGGAALEESPQLPAERGDPEQPGLRELEQAAERFSDPDGKAVQQQAQSLYHDLKAEAATRREKIQAATAALEGRGELRTVEPFPEEEPGYHRFRYLTRDGQEVTGNYTVDGNTIEGFNIGDTNNPKELGPKELLRLFGQIRDAHPDVKYVHGYRMSGARVEEGAGEQDVWMELTDKGLKRLDGPPEISPQDAGNAAPANESDQAGVGQPNDAGGAQDASEGLSRYPEIDHAAAAADPQAEARRIGVELARRKMIENSGMGHGYKWSDQNFQFVTATGQRAPKGHVTIELDAAQGRPVYSFKLSDLERDAAAAAPAVARVPSTDVSPEQFKQVWQSKSFKEAVAAMTARGKEDMPHRESPVAEAMVRGWIDGQKGDLEQLRAAADRALESEGQFQPNGFNPRQGYVEAYHAAATGEPREIRAIGNDRTMGVREALAELDKEAPALDRGEAEDPAIADRNRQLTQLGAEAPLRAAGDVDQQGEMGLGLFDHADQPELTFRLGDEGGEVSAEDLLKDLDADDKAIKAIKDCL